MEVKIKFSFPKNDLEKFIEYYILIFVSHVSVV